MKNNNIKQWLVTLLGATSLFFVQGHVARAQEESLIEDRALLENQARSDMDKHFTYAQKATKEHNAREAEWAYRKMLAQNPNLDRVKLDLALVLVPQGKLVEAKQLLEEVKSHNPPQAVQNNIDLLMTQVDKLLKPHQLSGGISFGVNFDTNANAAPSSGDITVLDTSIPLGSGAQSHSDAQLFGAVNVNHVYRYDIDPKAETLRWKTDFLSYGTAQNQLSDLNLRLYSLRTGPEITMLESGTKYGVYASYNTIELNGENYLDNPKLEADVDVPLTSTLLLNLGSSVEYRDYHNSPTVTTYEDRNGTSVQADVGVRYLLSDQWLLNSGLYVRHEAAAEEYFENNQFAISAGATYLIDPDTFISAQAGYHLYDYAAADPLISVRVRQDDEYSAGINIGRSIQLPYCENRIVVTAGYSYRDVRSNIQNYEYDNHRVMTTFSVAF